MRSASAPGAPPATAAHFIMGTAGHVDHGKTALVKALTGIECDTHPEEKARGITINLGFAFLDLDNGERIGIIDVPGHRDFISTMVAGAYGIDLACLVIAADSGVMPQTREHLQIMEILGLRNGVVALTKSDLVTAEVLGAAREQVREYLADSVLGSAAIVAVSAITGSGIAELKAAVRKTVGETRPRSAGGTFRMFIDRIFTVKGFGTVVTGSVLSGTLRTGDRAYLLPVEKELRVRRLERHGREVELVSAGDRASINLAGLDRSDFSRGMVIADRPLGSTRRIDVSLKLFSEARPLSLWSTVSFLSGTYEAQARLHLLDCDTVTGGGSALAQVHLPLPCAAQKGDRFIIRDSSGETTRGGGEIIDAFALHHRRRPAALVENLRHIAEGKLSRVIPAEVRKRRRPVSLEDMADLLNVPAAEVRAFMEKEPPRDILKIETRGGYFLFYSVVAEQWQADSIRTLDAFRRSNPLRTTGKSLQELLGLLKIENDPASEAVLEHILEMLVRQGSLKKSGSTWALPHVAGDVPEELAGQVEFMDAVLQGFGTHVPLMSELAAKAAERAVDGKRLAEILRHLVRTGRAYLEDGNYLHAGVVDAGRKKIIDFLKAHEQGITVAGFRDCIAGNRKICLLMLAIFDREGLTVRTGDVRKLSDTGVSREVGNDGKNR